MNRQELYDRVEACFWGSDYEIDHEALAEVLAPYLEVVEAAGQRQVHHVAFLRDKCDESWQRWFSTEHRLRDALNALPSAGE